MTKLVYIAGKYSAPTRQGVEQNIRAAEELAIEVARIGAMPICPHTLTSHPDFESVQDYPFWIAGTMRLMQVCDAVIFADGWHESAGARGEHEEAKRNAQPTFYDTAALGLWLRLLERPERLYAGTVSAPEVD